MSYVHLDLMLRLDAETLQGRLRHDDGTVRRFHGWLGLMDALDRLRAGSDPVESAPAPVQAPGGTEGGNRGGRS